MKSHPKQGFDRILFFTVIMLLAFGVLMVYSSSAFWCDHYKDGDHAWIFRNHLLRVGFALLAMVVVSKIDYHAYRKWVPFLLLGMIFLLILVLWKGVEVRGSTRFFRILGLRFQPSEFTKLVVVLYFSSVLSKEVEKNIENTRAMIQALLLFLVSGLVLLEPDLGTATIILSTGIVIFFLANIPWKIFFLTGTLAVGGIVLQALCLDHQKKQLLIFLNVITGKGLPHYQLTQSLVALASGGVLGAGYGNGNAKNLFLPQAFSDFILATLGEEFGFIGMLVLFCLVGIVLWRGIHIALHARDRYGALLAGGITSLFMITALINAGVTVAFLPTTGVPFPFISYGGASLSIYLLGIGILLNISKRKVTSYREFTTERGQIRWPVYE